MIVLPFAGFLASNHYPAVRIEAAAALGVLAGICGLLAAVFRKTAFYIVLLLSGSAVAAGPARRELTGLYTCPLLLVWLALALAGGALMLVAGEKFLRILAVFAVSGFAAHWHQAAGLRSGLAAQPGGDGHHPAHFLYLVLDEHMGPGGLPAGIGESAEAAGSIRETFRRYGFRLYPNAYSNFANTVDSIPSILRREVVPGRRSLLNQGAPDAFGRYCADVAPFFGEFRRRGYEICVIECRWLRWSGADPARRIDYTPDLDALAGAGIPWTEKFRVLVGNYQASDLILSRVRGFFPFRFAAKQIGPLSVTAIWPDVLANEILRARRPTFFFAHLLTPHGPYLLRKDGSVRRLQEWRLDQGYRAMPKELYADQYRRYCEQVEFVQSQLRRFFARLEEESALDPMTVVVHGDHGSRIRLATASGGGAPDEYDYPGTPDRQDLLDRFSALLAIKLPGVREASVSERWTSIPQVLAETVYEGEGREPGPAAGSVFLFDGEGKPREVRLAEVTESGGREAGIPRGGIPAFRPGGN